MNSRLVLLIAASVFLETKALSQDVIYLDRYAKVFCEVKSVSDSSNTVTYVSSATGPKRKEVTYPLDQVLMIRLRDGRIVYPKYFLGNRRSKRLHFPTSKHAPDQGEQERFTSIEEAELSGYSMCPACLNNDVFIPERELEAFLANAVNAHIRTNFEILYEYPRLHGLEEVLRTILVHWPEKLVGYEYRVLVYKSREPNAVSVAAGNIYVSSGLLDLIEDDEELQAVLAHEVAHIEKRHGLREYYYTQKQQSWAVLGSILAGVAAGAVTKDAKVGATVAVLTASVSAFVIQVATAGYSRDLEQEADLYAQIYLKANSIRSKALVSVLDKLAGYSFLRGQNIFSNAFSSHPDLIARMYQVEHSTIDALGIAFDVVRTDLGEPAVDDAGKPNPRATILTFKPVLMYSALSSIDYTSYVVLITARLKTAVLLERGGFIRIERMTIVIDDEEIQFTGMSLVGNEESDISFTGVLAKEQVRILRSGLGQRAEFKLGVYHASQLDAAKQLTTFAVEIPSVLVRVN